MAEADVSRVSGPTYTLTPDEISAFQQKGYITLRNVILPSELKDIEDVFDEFNEQKRGVDFERDFGDHSQGHGTERSEYNMINVNNPCRHDPRW